MTRSSKPEPLDNASGWRLWKCGGCERPFATETLEGVENCPYCGCETMVASEWDYHVIQE